MRMLWSAVAMAAALIGAQASEAAIVTQRLRIEASNFTRSFGDGSIPAIDPLMIIFSVRLDTSLTVEAATKGLKILSSNLPAGFAPSYAYVAGSEEFTLADQAFSSHCTTGAGSICMFMNNFLIEPEAFHLSYNAGSGNTYAAGRIIVALPEPGSWALMIAGFGLLGGVARRRTARRTAIGHMPIGHM